MLKLRLIAGIVVKDGIAVQSIGFRRFLPLGRPAVLAENLNRWGADELLLLDISAPRQGRAIDTRLVRDVAAATFIPLTVGGGIRTVEDVRAVVQSGADKVAINTAAVEEPSLVRAAADRFGSQCVVASLDAVAPAEGDWRVATHAGVRTTALRPSQAARVAADHGAGEILLTAIHRDGAKSGYDLALIESVTRAVAVPVIVMGGVGHPRHFAEAARIPGVSGLAAANFFAFTEHAVSTAKAYLAKAGVEVRADAYADYRDHEFDETGRVARPSDRDLDRLIFTIHPPEVI